MRVVRHSVASLTPRPQHGVVRHVGGGDPRHKSPCPAPSINIGHGTCRRSRRGLREGALIAEKRPVRKTDRIAINNDAVCSPEGIRTPDLFLEREAPWTTRRPG